MENSIILISINVEEMMPGGKGETQLEHQEKICLKYAEGAVTDQTHHKRYVKFCGGGSLLDDAPR